MNSLLPILALSDEFWASLAEIVFGTIFSIALIWVVMQIWKKEEPGENASPKQGEEPPK